MKIRAICLSDLHFGSETSVLTAIDNTTLGTDLNRISPVLKALVECLKLILAAHEGQKGGRKPSLVLAGDVLELALAGTNEATTVFTHFINLLYDKTPSSGESLLDPTIIYVPGNHDHHFWETSREHQYARYLNEPETKIPFMRRPWHATHLFPWRENSRVKNRNVESFLLNELVKRLAPQHDGKGGNGQAGFVKTSDKAQGNDKCDLIRVLTMYPNYGILSPSQTCRCAVIHHGHFTEAIYHLMTKLRSIAFPKRTCPEQIWDVEAENFAWIDFIWGTLGRSGGVGEDMEMAYNMFRSKRGTEQLIRNLAHSIPIKFNHWRWTRPIESYAIRVILGRLVKSINGLERSATDSSDSGAAGIPMSKESRKLMDDYINLYIRSQLKRECGKEAGRDCPKECGKDDAVPLDHLNLTFVFGHTHKPFEQILNLPGVANSVNVYNAGGWVVDTVETMPSHGGSIIVIDEDGHAASIRMYEQSDRSGYRVRVESTDKSNPLYNSLRELIDADKSPWSDFSVEVARAVEERHENMRKVIKKLTPCG